MNELPQSENDLFPFVRASEIPAEPVSENWLIEDLWTASSVGWVAGSPKSLKSWTALEMAVSVASGTACLGRYRVPKRGKALVYLAEDSLPAVRERLGALALQRGLDLDGLDVEVITASSMRLDLSRDQVRLQKTVRSLAPRLLVLDPLIRIHRSDENSSAEVSALLSFLRQLQRELDLAVAVVHHARKNGSSGSQGQGLRGSGDLWAWSDSALYLKRKGADVLVTVEHRSAAAPPPLTLRLVSDGPSPSLELIEHTREVPEDHEPLEERVLTVLMESAPVSRNALRRKLSVKNERLGQAIERLEEAGSIERTPEGLRLPEAAVGSSSQFPPIGLKSTGTTAEPSGGAAEDCTKGEPPPNTNKVHETRPPSEKK